MGMGAFNTFFNWRTAANTSAMRQQTQPQMSPERKAEFDHETRYPTAWLLYGLFSLICLYFAGSSALWFLVPVGVVIGLANFARASHEAGLSDDELIRESTTRQVNARARWDNVHGCTWCGSAKRHRGPNRQPQHPREFHADEIAAEIDLQAAARR